MSDNSQFALRGYIIVMVLITAAGIERARAADMLEPRVRTL